MTTPLVQSISDEVFADLAFYAKQPGFDENEAAQIDIGELRGLIARLRAAEEDAKRYRKIRADGLPLSAVIDMDSYYGSLELAKDERFDAAIDAAMERTP